MYCTKIDEDVQKETQTKIKASKDTLQSKLFKPQLTPPHQPMVPKKITKIIHSMDTDSRIAVFVLTDWL